MSVFMKTCSDRAANTFPRELPQCFVTLIQEVSISDQFDSSILQYEPIASYLGLFHLYLDSKFIIGDRGCLGFCFALALLFCFGLFFSPRRSCKKIT